MARTATCLLIGLIGFAALASSAWAQQPAAQGQLAPPPPAAAPKSTATKTPAAAPAGQGSEAQLRKRVEQLEEQLVDLQVVIGTLESLAKAPPASAAAPMRAAGSPADQSRIDGLETQIKALTLQLEQLSAEVRGGAGPRAQDQASGSLRPDAGTLPAARPSAPQAAPAGDAIGGLLSDPPASGNAAMAALAPGADDPKLAYEAAYGHMLQQNYGAAQAGFSEFLRQHPSHALVPNALYWLGETYYVQRNYADAAEAFDIVLSAHAASNKAPDSQLKKAMALSQLGKSSDACSVLKDLALKYPNAPSHVKSKADSERRRVGCI